MRIKKIEGYENYTIDIYGHVYNTKRKRYLKGGISHGGYLRVGLRKNNIPKSYSIHRLVAKAFIPNPLNKPCINHIDRNKTNNIVTNLEWCTILENIQYGIKMKMLHSEY